MIRLIVITIYIWALLILCQYLAITADAQSAKTALIGTGSTIGAAVLIDRLVERPVISTFTPEKPDRLYAWSRVAAASGTSLDLFTTIKGDKYTPEGNPIVGQGAARQLAVVGVLAFGLDLLTRNLHADHPRAASVINFVAGGAHTGAAAWNMHVIQEAR